ncbi:hypothetical protein MU0083_001008 [[Mycobacterium] kokjensenii]|uniref:Uncharacterized protein n=1 Tax=[Mycobacterium] kokjensenii TaxID=3064287 RepID=A0ABM9L971_9MYCO|nr:hypothetical protein [Mycolicibacter sp. MU0083]CAJ1495030.1 hypothetical protein MU0083_001008 [Mycolicibacter sp. MU0083]
MPTATETDPRQQLSLAIRELADLRKLLSSLLSPDDSRNPGH